jgi:hypothetical protein
MLKHRHPGFSLPNPSHDVSQIIFGFGSVLMLRLTEPVVNSNRSRTTSNIDNAILAANVVFKLYSSSVSWLLLWCKVRDPDPVCIFNDQYAVCSNASDPSLVPLLS